MALYLDYAATTPVDPRVAHVAMQTMTEVWGNPSSKNRHGFEAAQALRNARRVVANFVGSRDDELIFTSGATEGANTVLRGLLTKMGGHVIASTLEHKAVLSTLKDLESSGVITVTWINPSADGTLATDTLSSTLKSNTRLIVAMWVNNETGVVNPVPEIGAWAREMGVAYFCDATQAVGKIPVNLREHTDFAVFSAHKLYGPMGVGGLFVKKTMQESFSPYVLGGGQERGLRAGTENLPGIVGFAKACELAHESMARDEAQARGFNDLTLQTLRSGLDARPSIIGRTVPHTLSLTIPGVDNQALQAGLRDVMSYSSGSACNSYRHEPSHVLLASGLSEDAANSTIRLSFGRQTQPNELMEALRLLQTRAREIKEQ